MSTQKIYVKSMASIEVAHDSQFQALEYKRDRVTLSEEFSYQESGTVSIADAATVTVNLGSISEVKSIFLECDAPLDVKMDSAAVPTKLRPGANSGKSRMNLDNISVASIELVNPVAGGSGGGVRVSYQIAGD
jgi:hypothetical protein